jgi:hypothetical protein
MVGGILKLSLYAVDLISNLLRPSDQIRGVGGHCPEMAVESVKKRFFIRYRWRWLCIFGMAWRFIEHLRPFRLSTGKPVLEFQ